MKKIIFCLLILLLNISAVSMVDASTKTEYNLTLESALEKAVVNNPNILLFYYKVEMYKYQKDYTGKKLNDTYLTVPISNEPLPVSREYFEAQYPELEFLPEEEQARIQLFIDIQIYLNTTLNQMQEAQTDYQKKELDKQLIEQRNQYRELVKSIESDKKKNEIYYEQSIEAVKYNVTNQYINVLILENDIKVQKHHISKMNKQLLRLEKLTEVGYESQDSVFEFKELLVDEQEKLETLEAKIQLQKKLLAYDLNLPISMDLKLAPIPDLAKNVNLSLSGDQVYSTFQYRILNENLIYTKALTDAATDANLKKQYEAQYKSIEQEANLYKRTFLGRLEESYQSVQEHSKNIKKLERKKAQAERKMNLEKKRLDIGLISKFEYEQQTQDIEQTLLDYQNAKLAHIQALQAFKSIQRGYAE